MMSRNEEGVVLMSLTSQPVSNSVQSPTRTPLFIETTAQVDLLLGDPQVRGQLERILSTHETWTSTYVLMEFRRTAVHALEVARRLAAAAPDDEHLFTYMLRAIERGNGGFPGKLSARQQKRSREIVYMVMDRLDTMPVTRLIVTTLLESTILLVNDVKWIGIEHILNDTDCDLIQAGRPQGQRWPLHCNKQRALCQQSTLLERHRTMLGTVLTECEKDSAFDDQKMLATLRKILAVTPLEAAGEKRCWDLGDTIIAIEALPVARILSSNGKHFAPICRALALTLVSYSPYPTR